MELTIVFAVLCLAGVIVCIYAGIRLHHINKREEAGKQGAMGTSARRGEDGFAPRNGDGCIEPPMVEGYSKRKMSSFSRFIR